MQHNKLFKPLNIAYIAMFVALMAVGANVTAIITVGAIPLTMQTFFAIMAGALLGSRLGAVAMFAYMGVGLIGVPVFSHFTGGPGAIFVPTFGFIVAFIFVAYGTGKIIESSAKPSHFSTFLIASFAGLIINYVVGTMIIYIAVNTWVGIDAWSYGHTWLMMLPFLPKDIGFTVIAAMICPRVYRSIHRASHVHAY